MVGLWKIKLKHSKHKFSTWWASNCINELYLYISLLNSLLCSSLYLLYLCKINLKTLTLGCIQLQTAVDYYPFQLIFHAHFTPLFTSILFAIPIEFNNHQHNSILLPVPFCYPSNRKLKTNFVPLIPTQSPNWKNSIPLTPPECECHVSNISYRRKYLDLCSPHGRLQSLPRRP